MIDKALNFNLDSSMKDKDGNVLINPQFAFVATTVGQVEKIAWQYFKDYMKNIPGVKFNEQKLRITFPHPRGKCTIYLFGAENFDAMRGIFLDGYVLDEFADMHPDVRKKVLRPTISDRLGWEIIIGTPKGANNFKKIYDHARKSDDTKWFSCLFRASETGIINDEELADIRAEDEEAYQQEYECDWNAAPSGTYYHKYMVDAQNEGRICGVPYNPTVPVITYWDLGFNDDNPIWFVQEVGRELHIIDYYEEHGKGLEHYVKVLNDKPYHYAAHKLPHDADQTELSIGKSRVEFLEDHGLENIEVLERTANIAEDIHAVRMILPICWFDAVNTYDGREALSSYERAYDSREQVYKEKPKHNWASHAADAFRGLAVDYRPGFGTMGRSSDDFPDTADTDYDCHG